MIRLTTLLKEIEYPKKKWIPLDMKDLKLSAEDILDIIVKSYAPVGGHPEFKKPTDVTSSDLTLWFGQDADKEPDLDAVIAGKKTSFGNKLTVLGSDGGSEAKREVVKRFVELMKKNGNYVEASDRIGDILASSGVKIEKDPDVIKKVINKPDIEMGEDGWYTRSIGGTKHKKRLFGLPRA